MCLTTIKRRGRLGSGYGWKVYGRYRGRLRAWLFSQYPVLIGRWMVGKRVMCRGYGFKYYSGYHILLDKPDKQDIERAFILSRNDVVKKVKYRKGRIVGEWFGLRVIVADEMLILQSKKGGDHAS